jgi:hypothetical protein
LEIVDVPTEILGIFLPTTNFATKDFPAREILSSVGVVEAHFFIAGSVVDFKVLQVALLN